MRMRGLRIGVRFGEDGVLVVDGFGIGSLAENGSGGCGFLDG